MAKVASLNDLLTPMKSIETCLQDSATSIKEGAQYIGQTIDDLNSDVTSVLRDIARRMWGMERRLNKNAKAQATNAAANPGSGGIRNGLKDFKETAQLFSPQALAAGVSAFSSVKMKDVFRFPQKMSYATQGMIEPIKVLKENSIRPAEAMKYAGALTALGNATHDFVKSMRKTIISSKLIEKFTPNDVYKSGLFKAAEQVVVTIMTNIYGAKYNKRTRTFAGRDAKRAFDLNRGAKTLTKLGRNILGFVSLVALTAVVAPVALVGILITAGVVKLTTWVFKILGDRRQLKQLEQGGKALFYMGAGLITFEISIVMAAIIAPFAMIALGMVTPIVVGAMTLFSMLGDKKTTKNVKEAAWCITLMGLSLIVFSAALVLSSMILKAYLFTDGKLDTENLASMALTIPVFLLMMGSLWVFKKVGTDENMKHAGKAFLAILAISAGLIVFSLAMAISSMLTKDIWRGADGKIDPVAIVTTVAVFALLVGSIYAFKLAGSNLKDIAKGTVSVILMGIGLAIFGFATAIYMKALEGRTWEDIGKAAALIGIFGVEFILLGIPVVFGFVALGSASVALMAVALGVFGFGVAVYMKCIEDVSWEQVGQGAGILGVYGLEFAALGLLSPAIALADLAIGCMGPALTVFGRGLKEYMEVVADTKWETVIDGAKVIGVYGLEFAGLGLLSLGILAADAAMACMGLSLGELAKGLKPFGELFEEVKVSTFLDGAKIIGVLGGEFALLGPLSILIAPAAGAMKLMGDALQSIGLGLKRYMDAGVKPKDVDDLCYAIDRIKLIFIGQKKEDQNKGFFAKIGGAISGALAAPFDNVAIENTARGLKTAGTAIYELSKGLQKWVDADIRVEDMANMTTIIGTIGETFQRLGEKKANANTGGSLLQRLIGVDFRGLTKTDMELGIRSVQGLGKALEEIARGLVAWRDGMGKEFEGEKLIQLANQIAAVVGALGTAFASIASDENTVLFETKDTSTFANAMGETFATFTKQEYKNKVQLGIESCKGLGDIVVGLADGMQKMTEIAANKIGKMPTIDAEHWTIKDDDGKALAGVTKVLLSMGQVFAHIGEVIKKQGMYTEVIEPARTELHKSSGFCGIGAKDESVHIAAKTEQRSYIGLAISSLLGIGDIVSGIANALNTMTQIKNTSNVGELTSMLLGVVEDVVMKFKGMAELIEKGRTKVVTKHHTFSGTAYTETTNDTASFLENVSSVVKMTKDAKEVMTAVPELVKTLNKNKGEFEKFLKDGDDGVFSSIANINTLIAAMSGAVRENGAVGGSVGYSWYDENHKLTSKYFPWINNKAIKDATTNANDMIPLIEKVVTALGKLPKDKSDTELMHDAVVGLGGNVVSINVWFDEKDIESAGKKVDAMDGLLVKANTMLAKVPMEIKLLSDLQEANQGGAVAFDTLFASISDSIHRLDGQDYKIESTTNLINTLRKAKNDGVFSDLRSNVDKMVKAINTLDNEKMKPYADMVMALRDMSTENSKFKELFEELVKTIAKLIEEIKKAGTDGLTGDSGSGSGSSNSNDNRRYAPVPQVNNNASNAAIGELTKKITTLVGMMSKGEIRGTKNSKDGSDFTITFKSS